MNFNKRHRSWKYYLSRSLSVLGLSFVFGIGLFFIFVSTIKTQAEKELIYENDEISTQYRILSKQLDQAIEDMNVIKSRDEELYRVILKADSMPSILKSDNSNDSLYEKFKNMRTYLIVKETSKKMDILKRMLYVQSQSFDELVELAKDNDKRLQHIPAIQPIKNKDLRSTASGFGVRIDPVYNIERFHKGMDFSAPEGTEIYATGAGKIAAIGWKQGYGNCITIDHGYGYKTFYAHISHFKKGLMTGSVVHRGDVIAYVGNTGKATGPHLHYEVYLNGELQDPSNYYYLDLSPEQYDEMMTISAYNGRILD